LPVYDPNGSFVTGSGQIASPAGADLLNQSAAGQATFGFVSKYLPGRNTPSGNMEFQFKQGNLDFKSTSMDWLVVTGEPRAKFHGSGTVNGSNVCAFEVDAWAGSFPGNIDAFGLKISSCSNGGDRYNLPASRRVATGFGVEGRCSRPLRWHTGNGSAAAHCGSAGDARPTTVSFTGSRRIRRGGRRPLGDGFVSVPVQEYRGALVRSFGGGMLQAGVHFQIASGYTGQTTEVLALPGEGEPFERVVGVRIASYATAPFRYRFGRAVSH
jgi:hypothetical protein